ncbi:hypothetical protein ACTFIR_008189 [Dictyostelium discoideum]
MEIKVIYYEFGYNEYGYDKDGYDINGYDINGYDINDYDINSYDINGYDINGYNEDGYNKYGYNEDRYDKYGYNEYLYDKHGYGISGYDKNGYDRYGYDKNGYDKDDYDKDGYDKDNYNKNGYNLYGYDKDGYNLNGFDRDGVYIKKKKFDEITEKSKLVLKSLIPWKGFLAKNLTNFESTENDFLLNVLSLLSYQSHITFISSGNFKNNFNNCLNISPEFSKWNNIKGELEISFFPTYAIDSKGSRRPDLLFFFKEYPKIIIILEFKFFHKTNSIFSYFLDGEKKTNTNYIAFIESAKDQISTMTQRILDVSKSVDKKYQIINYLILGYKDVSKLKTQPEKIAGFGFEIYLIDAVTNEPTKIHN